MQRTLNERSSKIDSKDSLKTQIFGLTEIQRYRSGDVRKVSYNQLAWLLATCPEARYRDGRHAVELATKACELSEWQYNHVDTLAAAYAEAGDFEQAVRWQQMAIEMASDSGRDDYRSRLALYKSGKPYREEPKK